MFIGGTTLKQSDIAMPQICLGQVFLSGTTTWKTLPLGQPDYGAYPSVHI